MNAKLLEVEMVKKGLNVDKLSKKIGISDGAFYRKLNGVSDFYRREIVKIAIALKLSHDEMISIFFDDTVA